MNDTSAEEYLLSESDIPSGEYNLGEGDAPIRRYLLGTLAPAERQQVEVRLLIDDEFHEQVGLIEDELIDEYLYGELSENDRQKLGEILRSGPLQQRKLQLAEDLGAYLVSAGGVRGKPAAVKRGKNSSWWQSLLDSLRFRNPVVGFSLTLALLLSLLGGVAILFKVRQLEAQLVALEAAQQPTTQGREQELQRQLEQQNARVNELTAELQRAQEQHAQPDDEVATPKSPERLPSTITNGKRAPTTTPLTASIFLSFTQSRGAGPGPEKPLEIESGTTQAELILNLDMVNPASYKSLKAEVYEVDGPLIGSTSKFSRRKSGSGNQLVLRLPASRFRTGEYRLVLSGLTQGGQEQPIGISHFRVNVKTP